MMRRLIKTHVIGVASLLLLGFGCAGEVAPVNRVKTGALPKSFFLGPSYSKVDDDPEFYFKIFNVDGSLDIGDRGFAVGTGGAERIRWEITEDRLIARRAYQNVIGIDNKGVPGKDPNGLAVAIYKIESHFDIRRQYNTQTGEENNVVEENSTDKRWYERDYIRVDWSQNLISNPIDDASNFSSDIVPVRYTITDENAEDAPHLELDEGYFDVTNMYSVKPNARIQLPWGQVALECLIKELFLHARYNCYNQDAKVRVSFHKVDPNEDFEPFDDSKAWQDVVGAFTGAGGGEDSTVQVWDPVYGETDKNTYRFKYIHNIWKKSHLASTCGSNEDKDKNGTADECENKLTGYDGHAGSQCDVFSKKCTIPARDRSVKTIGFYVNKEADVDLLDQVGDDGKVTSGGAIEEIFHAWNQLLRVAVAFRREVECRRSGDGDRAYCHAQFFESNEKPDSKEMLSFGGYLIDKVKVQDIDEGQPVLTLCHNPVRHYDNPGACGKEGTKARLGDVRKHFYIKWPYTQDVPFSGVAQLHHDPLTGQLISASAEVMPLNRIVVNLRDQILLANGDLEFSDIIDGTPSERFSNAILGYSQYPFETQWTQQKLDNVFSQVKLSPLSGRGLSSASRNQNMVDQLNYQSKLGIDERLGDATSAEYVSLLNKVKGTQFASKLLSPSFSGLSDSKTQMGSELDIKGSQGNDPVVLGDLFSSLEKRMTSKGICFINQAPQGMVIGAPMARYYKNKYASFSPLERAKRIFSDMKRALETSVGTHEVGHALGMYHNFASSWDSQNYMPQYWQLRTNEGKATAECATVRSGDQDTCMGPRYKDAETLDERGQGDEPRPDIQIFGQTSTMEYQSEFYAGIVGLGLYDAFAMEALYGRVLQVYDPAHYSQSEQVQLSGKMVIGQTFADPLLFSKTTTNGIRNLNFANYTQVARLAKIFDLARDCRDATEVEKQHSEWRIVHNKVCSPPPKDHWAWSDFEYDRRAIDEGGFDFDPIPKGLYNDKFGEPHVRWPYQFGQHYGNGGYIHVQSFDAGADMYEAAMDIEKRYYAIYPWLYFRRGRANWAASFDSSLSAQMDRYYGRLKSYNNHAQFIIERGPNLSNDARDPQAVLAARAVVNFFARLIAAPEPGDYVVSVSSTPADSLIPIYDTSSGNRDSKGLVGNEKLFTVGIGDGRYLGLDTSKEWGGSWDYNTFPTVQPFAEQKVQAIAALVDSRPLLFSIGRPAELDSRPFYLSIRNNFPDAVDRILGSILSESWDLLGAAAGPGAKPELSYLDFTASVPSRPDASRVLFPNLGYQHLVAAGLYGYVFAHIGSDQSLANKLKLQILGYSGSAIPVQQQVRFTDPSTGRVYVARSYGKETLVGREIDKGIASRIVAHANSYLMSIYDVQKDTNGEPQYNSYGEPILVTDALGAPVLNSNSDINTVDRNQFDSYVRFMDAFVEFGRGFDGSSSSE